LTSRPWLVGFLPLAVLLGTLYLPASHGASRDEQYDALILQAREGVYEPALVMLRHRVSMDREDVRAIIDLIVIAGRAGRPEEVIEVYESTAVSLPLPAEALATVARAYRDGQKWNQALAVYRKGSKPYPTDEAFVLGETMVLADAGRTAEAVKLGRKQVARAPRSIDSHLALSYAYAQDNQVFAALQEADLAYTIAPQRNYVARAYVFALQRARLPEAALRVARATPGLLTGAQLRRLEGDAGAEQVRMSGLPARNERERLNVAQRTLTLLDGQIGAWKGLGEETWGDTVRARIDRIHVLYVMARMREAVAAYESLRAEKVDVPRYVLNDVAGAYLYLRQPERAEEIYAAVRADQAFDKDDAVDRLNTESGLYYAQSEADRQGAAAATIAQMPGEYPPWLYYKGQDARMPNDLHLQSRQLAAQSRLLVSDTPGAQRAFDEMVELAPYNSGLLVGRAEALNARSQPRAAELELKVAEMQSPRSLAVQTAQVDTALDLQEWRQAQLLSDDIIARYPDDLSARRAARAVALHNKSELQISGYRGIASDSAVAGNGDFGIEALLYSPPIDENWRAFGSVGYASGDFEEGKGHYRWVRAGAQWRGRDLSLEAEASAHNYGFGVKPGMLVSGTVDLSDQWQTGGSVEIRSRNTPLRALTNNISGNSLEAFVRWRADERREWTLSGGPTRFSDGNNRYALGLVGRERIFTSPDFQADLGLDVAVSRNTLRDTPYFNPRSDLTILPTVSLTHTLYRRYESSWTHTVTLGAGSYTQRDFGTGAILSLGYGQRWQVNDALSMGASVTGVSRPYDGDREREVRVLFDLNLRF